MLGLKGGEASAGQFPRPYWSRAQTVAASTLVMSNKCGSYIESLPIFHRLIAFGSEHFSDDEILQVFGWQEIHDGGKGSFEIHSNRR